MYRDEPIPGTVTRTSWALNVKSRTLRAEIDLPNPGSQILPGMYAYAEVIVERPEYVLCRWPPSPIAATRRPTGGTTTARRCEPKSRRASVTANGSKSQPSPPGSRTGHAGTESWTSIDGSEQVILGDLSILTEGATVQTGPAITSVTPDLLEQGHSDPAVRLAAEVRVERPGG